MQQNSNGEQDKFIKKISYKDLIDWYLTSTLAIFQLYRGVNKFYY
jgi:hypothetical protein